MLFSGPPGSAVPWFSSLQYEYLPERDGNVSDWLLDLVSVGFTKPEVSAWVTLPRCCDLRPSCGAAGACATFVGSTEHARSRRRLHVHGLQALLDFGQDDACLCACMHAGTSQMHQHWQLLSCRDSLCAAGKV